MDRLLAVVFLLLAVAASGSDFEKESLIRPVTDRVVSIEESLLSVIGRTRHALHFARFARRSGGLSGRGVFRERIGGRFTRVDNYYDVDKNQRVLRKLAGGIQSDKIGWMRFEKKYKSVEEITGRFEIFRENLDLIQSTNRKGLPYKLGINQFADMSWEEFQASRLGASQNCSATLKGNHKMTDEVLPETKDWREDGIVSPVKDQGHCGSCWTFSTTGSLEAAYTQTTGMSISLSEQQLVDCAYAFNNFGCNGGLPSQAFEYIKYNGGLDTEQSYPYAGVNGICSFKPENVGVRVLDSVNITMGAEDELKHAVGLVRPVSVAFQVVRGFKFYKGGVYTSDTCGSTSQDVNHAVLAVGYGVENGVPYWLIKNSWGSSWGVDGYFKMELGKNMCGVATCASYPFVAA